MPTPVSDHKLREAMARLAIPTPGVNEDLTVEAVLERTLPGCTLTQRTSLARGTVMLTAPLVQIPSEHVELAFALGVSLGRELGH
jgi:hypothetical protein